MIDIVSALFSAFIVFAVSWWLVLFMLLPVGIPDQPSQQDQGHDSGAPAKPNLRKKFRLATIISLVIAIVISALVESNLISLEAWLGITGWEDK